MDFEDFELLGPITHVETIAVGRSIRDLDDLTAQYGRARWRKLKGVAQIRYAGGRVRLAEVHWYEAHGVGRKRLKAKRFLD